MADKFIDLFSSGTEEPDGPPGANSPKNPINEPGAPRIAPVPENTFKVDDPGLLQLTEDWVGSFRAWEANVERVLLSGKFDAEHARTIHAYVMQDIYTQTGATRGDDLITAQNEARRTNTPLEPQYDTRIGAGGEHITLLSAGKVNARLDLLGDMLERENHLQGLKKPAFIEKLANYYTQYSHAAPFRSGNEHVLGVMIHQIGVEAGYEVQPGLAKQLREVVDRTLLAGVDSSKNNLMRALSSITTEAPSLEAQARRNPTQSALPFNMTEELKKRLADEEIN